MSDIEVKVPNIGDFKNVPVIEVLVSVGDKVEIDTPLVTLESDKATMEAPSSAAGEIAEILVKVGDKVSEGAPLVRLKAAGAAAAAPAAPKAEAPKAEAPKAAPAPAPAAAASAPASSDALPAIRGGLPIPALADFSGVHASPSVRRLARELEVDLTQVKGTGEKGRITASDVKGFLVGSGAGAAAPAAAVQGGSGIPEIPAVDFSKFGPVETKPLGRIKKISGPYLHRAWLNIPHVTHTDEADITEIDAYRKELDDAAKADKKSPYRVSLLPFLMKASVKILKEFPDFNSSLAPDKASLIYKKYYNIGVAVDTPDGLVVPVVRDVDRKGIVEISKELGDISARARDGKLKPEEMQGASFTISSLGGIGGTNFTPIVNAPEVAILGVVRSKTAPVWDGEKFIPRLMLPLCLSYDHRVIDGAAAARFTRALAVTVEDVRRLVL
ncbi:dihydrolipoyllysine-residue acetyltransferase [Neomegalonema sp.]|uniref:dihydrolipoyllysine-residue acetyltransferase n=1 Tax=Neomegalonema sp. TaxID=2039713 RepID=UPI00260601F3|nr:dihydrolipoyllysine-residue acetyltransferase [Neomegalonema sp.]MDD2869616.1 dihydrolipoyllysine-residue acetyltransferase [Neomegalonema sp.]